MFKNKIALKLTLNFAVALLILSIIIGSLFMVLFRNHTIRLHREKLSDQANTIADIFTDYTRVDSGFGGKGGFGPNGGYGAYLRFMREIAGTDVWVVDEQLNLITLNNRNAMGMGRFHYAELPSEAEGLIDDVFRDQTVFSEDFSSVLTEPTLTVGAPIKNVDGVVIGAVLLHTPIKGIEEATQKGFQLLGISILTALLIAFLLSSLFSYHFTQPLTKMKKNALLLAEGKYMVKNHINQKDEIGDLANTLDLLADRLDEASRQSEKLEQLRRDFVANISHELRTPITVIRGSLEALVEQVVTDEKQVEEYHSQMLKEAKYLQRLIGDLLDLSRLQNTDFSMEKTEMLLCDVIEDAARSISKIAEKKGVSIHLNLEESEKLDCHILGDYGRLRQMFMIILDNAVKFSKEGGSVEIHLKGRELSICDHGQGISKDELPYIFERFYKTTSEQNKTGTGLGLAISKQIAERHGIEIQVESTVGEGTKFSLYLKKDMSHK